MLLLILSGDITEDSYYCHLLLAFNLCLIKGILRTYYFLLLLLLSSIVNDNWSYSITRVGIRRV